MSFVAAVDRAQADFVEMPGLELTVPQAVRLWSLGLDDCRYVIDALVDVGFLKWTTKGTIVRQERQAAVATRSEPRRVFVRPSSVRNKPRGG